MDREAQLPLDIVKQMGELGLFGLPFPEEYGGSGADFTTLCIAIEELGRVDSSMAITLEAGGGPGGHPHFSLGTQEPRPRGAPPALAGRAPRALRVTQPRRGDGAGGPAPP